MASPQITGLALSSVENICQARLEVISLAKSDAMDWAVVSPILELFDRAAADLIDAVGSPDGWASRHG